MKNGEDFNMYPKTWRTVSVKGQNIKLVYEGKATEFDWICKRRKGKLFFSEMEKVFIESDKPKMEIT